MGVGRHSTGRVGCGGCPAAGRGSLGGSAAGVREGGALGVQAAHQLLEAREAQDQGLFVGFEAILAAHDLIVVAVDVGLERVADVEGALDGDVAVVPSTPNIWSMARGAGS